MEDTLRVKIWKNSMYKKLCLNPCFNGRYSQRTTSRHHLSCTIVLILVLMEDTLREAYANKKGCKNDVLILVLMEDTLRGSEEVDTDGNPQLS